MKIQTCECDFFSREVLVKVFVLSDYEVPLIDVDAVGRVGEATVRQLAVECGGEVCE